LVCKYLNWHIDETAVLKQVFEQFSFFFLSFLLFSFSPFLAFSSLFR